MATQKIFKYWLPPILWASFIFFLSSLTPGRVAGIAWIDLVVKKSAHMFEYAVLWVLLYRASQKKYTSLLLTVIYAVTDEYHQSFVPGRHSAFMDIGFDALGGTIAMIGTWRLLPKAPRKLKTLAENWEIL